jgi:hypothetical protein
VIGFASYFADTAPGFVVGYLQRIQDDRRSESGLTRLPPSSPGGCLGSLRNLMFSANEANFRKRSQW